MKSSNAIRCVIEKRLGDLSDCNYGFYCKGCDTILLFLMFPKGGSHNPQCLSIMAS